MKYTGEGEKNVLDVIGIVIAGTDYGTIRIDEFVGGQLHCCQCTRYGNHPADM